MTALRIHLQAGTTIYQSSFMMLWIIFVFVFFKHAISTHFWNTYMFFLNFSVFLKVFTNSVCLFLTVHSLIFLLIYVYFFSNFYYSSNKNVLVGWNFNVTCSKARRVNLGSFQWFSRVYRPIISRNRIWKTFSLHGSV